MNMYPIYFLTSNNGKVATMRKWVTPLGIQVKKYRKKINIPERKLPTVEEVAKYKVIDIYNIIKAPFVVQDSGFFIEALPGYPGPDVNRVLSTIGLPGLLGMVPQEIDKRGCYFEDILVFWSPTFGDPTKPAIFKSTVHGKLAYEPSENLRPEAWSKLWTIFQPDGFESTLAAMNRDEQNRFAREVRSAPQSNCFVAFADWLKSHLHYLYTQTSFDSLIDH